MSKVKYAAIRNGHVVNGCGQQKLLYGKDGYIAAFYDLLVKALDLTARFI